MNNNKTMMLMVVIFLAMAACGTVYSERQSVEETSQSLETSKRRIIYVDEDETWAMDEDGQNKRVIWHCAAAYDCAEMSPDWSRGVYLEKGENKWNLRLREAEKEKGRILLADMPQDDIGYAWAADGQYLGVWSRLPLTGVGKKGELYIMEADTGEKELIERGVAGIFLSPDSKRIAFYDFRPEKNGIYVEDMERDKRIEVVRDVRVEDVNWSPDSQKLVMKISLEGDIYISNLAGGTLSRVTDPEQYNYETATNPVWSPDGKKIAYIARYVDSGEQTHFRVLFIHDVVTGKQTPLVEQVQRDEVVWSPDSQKIIYQSHENRNYYIIDIETKQTTKILDGEVGNVIAWE